MADGAWIALALLASFAAAGFAVLWWRARAPSLASTRAVDAAATAATAARERDLVERAAAAERERIHADLHDDLGARLLELIYAAPDAATADRGRAILQDLRDVVTRARGEPGTLLDVLADIEGEARQRLAAAGLDLAWMTDPQLPDPALDSAAALHLRRIVREAISNVIRHAGAGQLRVRARLGDAGTLWLELTDDGSGPPLSAVGGNGSGSGAGMRGMQARAQALQGEIDWRAGTLGGTKVLLKAPLPGATPP